MVWALALIGGGLVWNGGDSFAGFFLASDGAVEAFSLVCGFVLVEIMAAGLIVSDQLAPHAHGLVQSELPVLALVVMCTCTALCWRGKPGPAFGVLIASGVYAFVHFKIWQWWIPNVVLGSGGWSGAQAYLSAMGLPAGTSRAADIRNNFNTVALQGRAVTMAVVAGVIGIVLTSTFYGAKRAVQPSLS